MEQIKNVVWGSVKMRRVLIVSTVSRQFYLFEQGNIEILRSLGFELHCAANFEDANERLDDLDIIRHHFDIQRSPFSIKNLKAYNQLKEIIELGQFDIIHCHSPMGGVLTRLVAKSLGIKKVIYTAHGFHFYKGAPIINWLLYYPVEKYLSKYTNTLITINIEDYRTAINRGFYAENITMVHGIGIDLEKFQPCDVMDKLIIRKKYGYKKNDFILFYAAELNNNKHQDLLINAVNLLKNKIPDIKLLLAGEGASYQKYKKLVKELEIEDKVILLGYCDDIREILLLSDVAVASSKREGLPVNVMEAMASKLPLVVTDVRGHNDLVSDGENGYVVELNNIKGFAKSINKLYENKSIRHEFGQKGIKKIQNYSKERILEKMESIYMSVLNSS